MRDGGKCDSVLIDRWEAYEKNPSTMAVMGIPDYQDSAPKE